MAEISNIYFITHPAFNLERSGGPFEYSKKQIDIFVETVLHPLLLNSQRDKNSVVVFNATPLDPGLVQKLFPKKEAASILGKQANIRLVEDALESRIRRMLKNRAIIIERDSPLHEGYQRAFYIAKEMQERGFSPSKNLRIWGYGSQRDICATNEPRLFIECNRGTFLHEVKVRLTIPGSGTIGESERFRRMPVPKTKEVSKRRRNLQKRH